MKLLKCKLCKHEMEIVANEKGVNKKVKCLNSKCGYTNENDEVDQKGPEVIIMRKRT